MSTKKKGSLINKMLIGKRQKERKYSAKTKLQRIDRQNWKPMLSVIEKIEQESKKKKDRED